MAVEHIFLAFTQELDIKHLCLCVPQKNDKLDLETAISVFESFSVSLSTFKRTTEIQYHAWFCCFCDHMTFETFCFISAGKKYSIAFPNRLPFLVKSSSHERTSSLYVRSKNNSKQLITHDVDWIMNGCMRGWDNHQANKPKTEGEESTALFFVDFPATN